MPKTFELVSVDGKLEFASYEQFSVPKGSREKISLVSPDPFLEECLALIDSDPLAAQNKSECQFDGTKTETHDPDNYVPVSVYFNDIWWYDLDCPRFGDAGCEYETWHNVDPGATLGGCTLYDGVADCTHPTERYSHGAQIIQEQFLVVYGGFSHFCEDYCDDAWLYVLPREGEPLTSQGDGLGPGQRWVQLEILSSPGKRWKASSTLVDSNIIFMFGGHRLWHGFSSENDRTTAFQETDEMEKGGYLNDLWKLNLTSCVLANESLATTPLQDRINSYAGCKVEWEEILAKQNCTSVSRRAEVGDLKPGYEWEERHDILCREIWPVPRMGHSLANFEGNLYLYGGYHTFFPYSTSSGPGSGPGTTQSPASQSFRPYPAYNFYLDDFWQFDLENGYWHTVDFVSPADKTPGPRTEHTLIATLENLVLFGGYRANHHMNDFWFYNVTSRRWLRKDKHVHPLYPPNCTEGGRVFAYPTLGTELDGRFGRPTEHVVVNLTRRQAPGWDGCRDRADGRDDLPWEMQWREPSQRSHHAVAFSPFYEAMFMFGGHGPLEENLEQVHQTHKVLEHGDLWAFNMHQCTNNCSDHGECRYGYCLCNSGYYGYDCSNTSCPGDFCYYDEITNEQVCQHCCHAPYVHTDNDVYAPDVGKKSCSKELPGHSNGVCNGDGVCLCAPPFIGLDCAIKDCPINEENGLKCSGNGWCSEEYPVSRCMCDQGFTGLTCEEVQCLNNCSYPNGVCDLATGKCTCVMWPDPYNRTRDWRRYEGMDCSYLIPYASSWRMAPSAALQVAAMLFVVLWVEM